MQQIIDHALFNEAKPEPTPLPEAFFGFLSHMQAQAAADAGAIYAAMLRNGFLCWYDMKAPDLTLEGMYAGVRASKVFILILTRDVLTRPFCQKELLCAIAEGKRIIVLVEEDARFFSFDRAIFTCAVTEAGAYAAAEARSPGSGTFPSNPFFTAMPHAMHADMAWTSAEAYIAMVAAVAEALARCCVIIRRREHEVNAMVRQVAWLGGFELPPLGDAADTASAAAGPPFKVYIIAAAKETPAAVASAVTVVQDDVKAAVLAAGGGGRTVEIIDDDAAAADKVLVILTAGTLADGSASLAALAAVLAADSASSRGDRLLLVHLPRGSGLNDGAAFDFGGAEVQAAPAEVRSALHNHEALAFRPRVDHRLEAMRVAAAELLAATGAIGATSQVAASAEGAAEKQSEAGGRSGVAGSYEWVAMARHLGEMLGHGGGVGLGSGPGAVTAAAVATVRSDGGGGGGGGGGRPTRAGLGGRVPFTPAALPKPRAMSPRKPKPKKQTSTPDEVEGAAFGPAGVANVPKQPAVQL